MAISPGIPRLTLVLCTLIALVTFGCIGVMSFSPLGLSPRVPLGISVFYFWVSCYAMFEPMKSRKEQLVTCSMALSLSATTAVVALWAMLHLAPDATWGVITAVAMAPLLFVLSVFIFALSVYSGLRWTFAGPKN